MKFLARYAAITAIASALWGCSSVPNNEWIDLGNDDYSNYHIWYKEFRQDETDKSKGFMKIKAYDNNGTTAFFDLEASCSSELSEERNLQCYNRDGDHLPKEDKCYDPIHRMIEKRAARKLFIMNLCK